ncbi:MAG: 16S rRNA (guanine(966)-N(2))-methyltransferase RsmD [Anaerorhabdus sp.]
MRVIAGEYRSRLLKSCPGDGTRPTLDKVKEAVFSSLGSYFDKGRALDLFAGSGAIGIECLSRGMEFCLFVDKSGSAINTIKENLKSLSIENQMVLRSDYHSVLQQCAVKKEQFDLIYLDPPYEFKIVEEIVKFIADKKMLTETGCVVCETGKDNQLKESIKDLKTTKVAQYGITKITIYKKKED